MMKLKVKTYVEDHKKTAQAKLAARQALLATKGMDEAAIGRDALIRKMKAQVRKAGKQLKNLAGKEKLIEDMARIKAEKIAAKKKALEEPAGKPAKKAPAKGGDKPKKEKKKQQQ
jgi:hypothetical protein